MTFNNQLNQRSKNGGNLLNVVCRAFFFVQEIIWHLEVPVKIGS
jgi:hypothetical protein